MKTLYLFRHGLPDKAAGVRNADIPLSVEGRLRVLDLGERLGLTKGAETMPVYASPYKRAWETALFFGAAPAADPRLTERCTGRPGTFTKEIWAGQYVDETLSAPEGESFREVRARMTEAVNAILDRTPEGHAAVVVSHAAAICAYLQRFCAIDVTDVSEKRRRIVYRGTVVLDGAIEMPSCFVLRFDDGLAGIEYRC